LAWYFYC